MANDEHSGGGYERASSREQSANRLRLEWPIGAAAPGTVQFRDTFWGNRHHAGLDIPAPRGTQVWATSSGRVERSRFGTEEGNYVAVRDAAGRLHYYLHLQNRSPLLVGDPVVAGQTFIGLVGDSGRADGPHLHYAIILPNGHALNPYASLAAARARENPAGVGCMRVGSGGAGAGVGEDADTRTRTGRFAAVIERLRREVSHWSYSANFLRDMQGDADRLRQARELREMARDNVLTGLRTAATLVRAGRFDDATTLLEGANNRWGSWLESVSGAEASEVRYQQQVAASNAFTEFARDVAEVATDVGRNIVQGASWGLGGAVLVVAVLYAVTKGK